MADSSPAAAAASPSGSRRGGGRSGGRGGGHSGGETHGDGGAAHAHTPTRTPTRPHTEEHGEAGGEKPAFTSGVAEAGAIPSGPGVFKVRADTRVKLLSGALAACARDGTSPMRANAIGAGSVNQALKAIIIARSYVADEELDFEVRPEQLLSIGPDAMSLVVTRVSGRIADASVSEEGRLRVAAGTRAGAMAGAIAMRIRGGASALSVSGIGPASVLKMVKALALAASYLQEDAGAAGTAPDLYGVPRFVDVRMAGEEEERTGVVMDVYARKV